MAFTSVDVAWAAGFLDAEGCIQIKRWMNRGVRPTWILHLSADQGTPTPLLFLHRLFGGSVHKVSACNWRWLTAGAPRVTTVLAAIKPFLRVKTQEAGLALDFARLMTGKRERKGQPLSETEQSEREKYREALHESKVSREQPVATYTTLTPEEDLAWAAGFIDGDGCITIDGYLKTRKYLLELVVDNTRLLPLTELCRILKVEHVPKPRLPGVKHGRPTWSCRFYGQTAATALRKVQPLLKVKQEEADTALGFADIVERQARSRVTAEVLEERHAYYTKLRVIKGLKE